MPGGLGNAITDAFRGLTSNIVGVGRGTNPLSQPQITDLFGFNIPGVPLISTRDYFLLQLQSWLTTIPLQTQWIAVIDSFPYSLRSSILQGLERNDGARRGYDIDQAKTLLTSFPFQKVIGCVFAQGAQVPGERCVVSDIGVENNRGFIPGIISETRAGYSYNPLQLKFLETNTSFIDFIMRPWIMLASHYGQVAYPGDRPGQKSFFNVKTNITLLCYTRSYQNVSQIPRKVFTFYNCVPTLINNFQLDYGNHHHPQRVHWRNLRESRFGALRQPKLPAQPRPRADLPMALPTCRQLRRVRVHPTHVHLQNSGRGHQQRKRTSRYRHHGNQLQPRVATLHRQERNDDLRPLFVRQNL